MARKKTLLQNKPLGHLGALAFFVLLGYFFYYAASEINYEWKWTSVPKYFVFTETKKITAASDGECRIENGKLFLDGALVEFADYDLSVKHGDLVYEGDTLAVKTSLKPGPILLGLWVTLKISFFSVLLTFAIGIVAAAFKLSGVVFLEDLARVYVSVIRGTPLLVQIFLFYFIVANIFELDRFVAGVLSLGIFFGAYMAEVLRGAIISIDKGQTEAAVSLGISKFNTMRYIIFPQSLKRALPTLVNEMIALVKDSSLVSVIAITDLTKVGREIVSNTFSPFETWIVIAFVYFSITFALGVLGFYLEKYFSRKGGF